MLEKFCQRITNYIRTKMPNMDDEKAEIINFGLLVLLGECPKLIILVLLAWWLDILFLTLITLIAMALYRTQGGGLHLHGHIHCFLFSTLIFCGTGLLAQAMLSLSMLTQYLLYILIFIFAMIVIDKYAPADTKNIPMIRPKLRKRKMLGSYIAVILLYIFAVLISKEQIISNVCILVVFIQSLTMTSPAYMFFKCEYGEGTKQQLNMV